MPLLKTQQIDPDGLTPVFEQAGLVSFSDTFTPDARTFLYVANGGATTLTITVVATGSLWGGQFRMADVVVTVPSGQSRLIGPFPAEAFADPSTGAASVRYSATASVTVGAFQLGLGP